LRENSPIRKRVEATGVRLAASLVAALAWHASGSASSSETTRVQFGNSNPNGCDRPGPAIERSSAEGEAEVGTVEAEDGYRTGPIVVSGLWARPNPGGTRLTAGYLKIANTGSEPDRLIGGCSSIAHRIEIHASDVTDGIVRMRTLHDGVEILPGETIELRPGGKHLMFAQLENSIAQGQKFEAVLVFEKAGPLAVEFSVRGL
jgi:copper(I)-binding protein